MCVVCVGRGREGEVGGVEREEEGRRGGGTGERRTGGVRWWREGPFGPISNVRVFFPLFLSFSFFLFSLFFRFLFRFFDLLFSFYFLFAFVLIFFKKNSKLKTPPCFFFW